MKDIEIYVHKEDSSESILIKIAEDATIGDLIQMLHTKGLLPCEPSDELNLMIEDEEAGEPFSHGRKLCESGIKHRKHIHCHRCRHVHVFVAYNGAEHEHNFSPATRVEKVQTWAVHKFGLTGQDAQDMVLRLQNGEELSADAHIGSYARFPQCEVRLNLTARILVNG